jgi:hypothetical protein
MVDFAQRIIGFPDVNGHETANADVAKIADKAYWRLDVTVDEEFG